MTTIKEKQLHLYEQWKKERNYDDFVYDGILSYEKWDSIIPKIMFLLKETADDFTAIAEKAHDITNGNGTHFWWNICYWKYLIDKLYKNEEAEFIDSSELPEVKYNNNLLDSIAYVNIKKNCDNNPNSNDSVILDYAKSDQLFLVQQIDLIGPDIVFCSNATFNAYKCIYKEPQLEKLNDICYKHGNRLILKFRHPSYFQISGGRETNFNDLKNALSSDGNILKQFNWGKS